MKLAEFAAWALKEGPFSGCDLDGGDVQDTAFKLGLLKRVNYNPEVHGESAYAAPGDPWYVFSDDMEAVLKGGQ